MSEKSIETQIGKRLGDLNELPEVLRKQLTSQKLDAMESKVIGTIKTRYAGIASIDEIMVGLYRDSNHIVTDRKALASKLYRMLKANLLETVKGRKGVYRLPGAAKTWEDEEL